MPKHDVADRTSSLTVDKLSKVRPGVGNDPLVTAQQVAP